MNLKTRVAGLALLFAATANLAPAALIISSTGSAEVIDFTGFTGAGFAQAPAAGQLDSDEWRIGGLSTGPGTFGGTHDAGDFARGTSTGGVTTGGIYSFEVSAGNPALGFQATGSDVTPGDITLQINNGTGQATSGIVVSYDVWVFNDQGRANSLNFAHSSDDLTYTNVGALDFTSAEAADAVPVWVQVSRSTTITTALAAGDDFFLQWNTDDVSGAGSRDEFAIDNISVTLTASAVPEPSSWALLALMGGVIVYRRRKKTSAA